MSKKTSEKKKKKYADHPAIAVANKLRRVKKQARLYPNSPKAQEDLARLSK